MTLSLPLPKLPYLKRKQFVANCTTLPVSDSHSLSGTNHIHTVTKFLKVKELGNGINESVVIFYYVVLNESL
jgi:hypothetical protein